MNDFDFDKNIFWVDPNFNYNKNNFLFKVNPPEEIRSFAIRRLTETLKNIKGKIHDSYDKSNLIIQSLQIMEDLSYIYENSSVENIYYYKYLIPFSVIPLKNYSFVKLNKSLLWFDFSEFEFDYGNTFVETYLPSLLNINFINSPSNEDAFDLKSFENNNRSFIESFFLNSLINDYSILGNKDLHSKAFSQVLDIIYQELYLKFEENVNSKAVTSSQRFYNQLKAFRKKLTGGELIVTEIIEFNQNLIKK